MVRIAGVVVLVLGACAGEEPPGVLGSPRDVRTAPGSYDGYDVVTPCARPAPAVGVVGRGTIAVTTVDAMGAIGGELHASFEDVESLWAGGGFGLGCGAGVGTQLYVDDWRDVDALIARTGAFLRARDLALEVAITVEPVPEEAN